MGLAKTAGYWATIGAAIALSIMAITVLTQSGGNTWAPTLWAARNVVFTALWPGWYVLLAAKVDAPIGWADSGWVALFIALNALIYAAIGSSIWGGERKSPFWYVAALPFVGLTAFLVFMGPWQMLQLVLWLQTHGQRVH